MIIYSYIQFKPIERICQIWMESSKQIVSNFTTSVDLVHA